MTKPVKKTKKTTIKKKPKLTAFQKFVARVERSNKSFKKASPAKKIVMVAKDVLDMLRLRRFAVTPGTYVEFNHNSASARASDTIEDVGALLKLPKLPACNVCAIGAGMVAATLRLDDVAFDPNFTHYLHFYSVGTTEYVDMESGMSQRALDVFTNALLRKMERAFEYNEYGYTMRGDKDRLRAIYQNLVKNKGKKFTHHDTGSAIWSQ